MTSQTTPRRSLLAYGRVINELIHELYDFSNRTLYSLLEHFLHLWYLDPYVLGGF